MAWQLRAFATLLVDPSSVPRSQTGQLTVVCNCSSRRSNIITETFWNHQVCIVIIYSRLGILSLLLLLSLFPLLWHVSNDSQKFLWWTLSFFKVPVKLWVIHTLAFHVGKHAWVPLDSPTHKRQRGIQNSPMTLQSTNVTVVTTDGASGVQTRTQMSPVSILGTKSGTTNTSDKRNSKDSLFRCK